MLVACCLLLVACCLLLVACCLLLVACCLLLVACCLLLVACCLLLVACCLFVGSGPRAAPVLGSSPRRCSFLVPFLGLGGAPARSLPWPRRSPVLRPRLGAPSRLLTSSPLTWCSARNIWPRLGAPLRPRFGAPPRFLGAPHKTCGLGPFLGLSRPRFFGLASVLLLGSLPSTRCSAQNLRPRLGAPPWLLGVLPRFLGAPR
jgi:hypothetical protein